jgi:hypothetical protein
VAAAATASKPAQASPQQPPPPASRLAAAKKGKIQAPQRWTVYGPEGVGKSSLFSYAPNPLWLDIEDGTAHLDVTRYPFRDGPDGHVPQGYAEVLGAIDDLTRAPHGYKTLVIDTADRLEALMWKYIVDRDNAGAGGKLTSVESYGYGKGYQVALDEWRNLCSRLDRLRTTRGMSIAFLAHSVIRTFKNPEATDFDRYQLAVQEKAAGFLKGWSDVVGFLRFEEGVNDGPKGSRAKGWSSDQRILCLSRKAAFDAKGRGMPAEVEVNLDNPWAAIQQAQSDAAKKAEEIVALIEAEVARIGDEDLKGKVKTSVDDAVAKGDVEALDRYLIALKGRPAAAAATAA